VSGKVRALAVQHSQAYEAPQGDGDGVWADNQDALKETSEGKPRRYVTD